MQLVARGCAGRRRPGGRRRRARARGGRSRRCCARRAPPGSGFAWLPADEALAGRGARGLRAAARRLERRLLGPRVGGLGSDVVARFLDELADGAGLNVHIRVLEGKDPQNVLRAIFKALGAAIGQACRTPEGGEPE